MCILLTLEGLLRSFHFYPKQICGLNSDITHDEGFRVCLVVWVSLTNSYVVTFDFVQHLQLEITVNAPLQNCFQATFSVYLVPVLSLMPIKFVGT